VVIPVYDKNPLRRTAYVTYALIVLNIVIFAVGPTAQKPGTPTPRQACAEQRYFVEHGAIPSELVSGRQLGPGRQPGIQVKTTAGEIVCTFPALPAKSPFLSVLTAMFIHAGWLHLAGNMLFLLVFGNNIEDRLGRFHFLLFYLVSGYLATYTFAFLNPAEGSPLVGASGAIAGVLGSYLYLYPRAKVTSLVPFLFFLPLRFPAWAVLGSWFLLQLPPVQGLLGVPADGTVAYLAHVAGFLAGFSYMLLLTVGRRLSARPRPPVGLELPLGPPALGPVRADSAAADPYGAGNPFPWHYPQPPAD
jgi:membrane associated rhomboid family serine protease